MTLLAELFGQLDAAPSEVDAEQSLLDDDSGCRPEMSRPSADDLVHAPALPTTSPEEKRRNAWRVVLGGRPICVMVGDPMTRAEALEAACLRWPGAEVDP